MTPDAIVEAFVDSVRRHGGTISPRTIPSVTSTLEKRLSFRLPYFYRRLIDKYEILPFEIRSLEFFGAFGAPDDADDITCSLFRDPVFVSVLLPARFFHFARPDTGSYDPVCVDLSKPGSTDGPIVRLDHEAILLYSKVRIVRRVARSLQQFMEDAASA